MRVWLMRASELMPVVDGNDHLLRMGLLGEKLSESREINHMLHFFIKSSFLPIDIL